MDTTNFQLSVKKSQSLVVKTTSDRQLATNLWDAIRAFRKQAMTQKDEVCKPLKTAWDAAKKPFDAFIKECEHYEGILQEKMGTYDLEQERLVELEKKKLQKKIDIANQKTMMKAEAKGVVPILKEMPMMQPVNRAIETQAGTTQTRQKRIIYTVVPGVDAQVALMCDFPSMFVIDKVKFNAHAKAGMFDTYKWVDKTEEFVYVQRQGNQIPVEEDGEGL